VLKKIAALMHSLKIPLPEAVVLRLENSRRLDSSNKLLNSIFQGRELQWHEGGYWEVSPMPEQDVLDKYYENSYWAVRTDRPNWLRHRDLSHFAELEPFLRPISFGSSKPIAANFGSGHGGISFLLWAMGFAVTNIDPYPGEIPYFSHATEISKIEPMIDFFYGSHSFEHVTSVQALFDGIEQKLSPGGYLYVEVPNALYQHYSRVDSDGVRRPRIQPPHTVYYTVDFFRGLPFEVLLLDTYRYEGNNWGEPTLGVEAEVIRFLGRKPI